jgi:AraC-like DNA-binding protein/streptogramin lyase
MGKGVFKRIIDPKTNAVDFIHFSTHQGLTDKLVTSITEDSKGNLWFNTFNGAGMLPSGGDNIVAINTANGLQGKMVNDVFEDSDGNIQIATDKGLSIFSGGNTGKDAVKNYLQGISVTCIYEEPGGKTFWYATNGAGLKRFKNGKFASFSTEEGMITNFIYRFFEDNEKNFWLMSDSGVLRVSKQELDQRADGGSEPVNCVSFGVADGMKSPEFNNNFSRNSALKDKKGRLWFVTKKGISIVDPGNLPVNRFPPPVVVESVEFNGEPVTISKNDGNIFSSFQEIRFRFTAPTFLSPEKIRFKYRLEGFEADWIYLAPGSGRTAVYKDLKPGEYTFNVTACNSEGIWNPGGDSVSFSVEESFYQSPVFKGLVILFFILFAVAGFYYYSRYTSVKAEAEARRIREEEEASRPKYQSSPMNPAYAKELSKKLTQLMEKDKLYRDTETSLPSLAEKLSVSPHQLSQLLNETLNRNFSDFINSYRIEEAKEILQSPKGEKQKIASIAFDVGFNTTVAFYNAFKKYTDMTPAQFKKKHKAGKKN